jgi:sec-independent protein translocase protein TatB
MMSLGELLLTAFVALIVFGPKQLPQLAYTLSSTIKKIKAISHDLKFQIDNYIKEQELRQNQLRAEEAEKMVADPEKK